MGTAVLLRQARQAAGLSQAELAHRAGTSQPAVARYETGVTSPAVSTLERLLHATGHRLTLAAEPTRTAANFAGVRMTQLRAARPEVLRTARKIGVRNVRVFGSVTRGEDDADSDVDLLVDFDTNTHGAFPLIRLRRELTELLGQPVDIATPDLLRPEVADRALAEAVPL